MNERLRLIVAYDGTRFAGWQSQKHGNTIQDLLETAFGQIARESIRVHGAGRTDSGVHALAQCAHTNVSSDRFRAEEWTIAVNSQLPPQIRVLRCQYVSEKFHARFSAKGKLYRYRVATAPILWPHDVDRAWHVPQLLDHARIREAASLIQGTHDFASFTANRGRRLETTVRTIRSVKIRRGTGQILEFDFEGDGFLYKMVRFLAAALVRCGRGRISVENVAQLLASPVPGSAQYVAPACGLFLVRVRY
jgi:tRNA pseudouridine38-40 synthase